MIPRSRRSAIVAFGSAAFTVAVLVTGCDSTGGLTSSTGGSTASDVPHARPDDTGTTPSVARSFDGETFRPTGATETAKVIRVVDGDTIVVRRGSGGGEERLRYIGIDTPETKKPDTPVQWMGPEASAANAALVEGRTVVLEKDVSETDRFGRLLRYVWLVDGDRWTLVDLELVGRGFAQVETDPPDVKYADRFLEAQRAARSAEVGLWGPRPSPSR